MNLILPVLSNALLVVLLYLLEKHTAVQKLSYKVKQLAYGILFGGLAIFASECGMTYQDVVINVRDASPLCAGLIFGAPAGVLSGVIGGAYRFFFGMGDYTRLACSLSTVLSGCIAALLRKLMFDDKKPTWAYGIGIACVCEDIHMLMIFLLNLNDSVRAFSLVQQCIIPMVLGNAASVLLAILAVSLLSREKLHHKEKSEQISRTFQRWLFVCIMLAYFVTSAFTYRLQSDMAETQARSVVSLTLRDVYQDIADASDAHLLSITNEIKTDYLAAPVSDSEALLALAQAHGVTEINLIQSDGIISASSDPSFVGYDMASGEQSGAFLCLFEHDTEYVQEYQPISSDASISRKYAAIRLPDGSALQAGYSYEQFKHDIDTYVRGVSKNRHVANTGFVVICNEQQEIVMDDAEYAGRSLLSLGIALDPTTMQEGTLYEAEIGGTSYLFSYLFGEGYYIIGTIPVSEATLMRDASIYVSILIEIIIFACLFLLVYFLIKRVIINNLHKINETLSQITDGNLNVKVDVRSNAEFASLSDDINSTVSVLKRYIAEAAARIDKELEYAKQIQLSALPSKFPPYPDQSRFDIYAQMIAAKEVGGDFYDFYRLDENTVAFLVADVSGKGIPASLFMMTAKTIIKDLAENRLPVNEIFTKTNEKLCQNNESGMFVTAWMGILNLKTGKLQYANAGHNPPLLLHDGGGFEYLKARAGFVLAGMEGIRYRLNELTLSPGDRIFLYTDGVTEATNAQQQLYGEERLLRFMDEHAALPAESLLHGLKDNIDHFVGGAPQFDDITMLLFDYLDDGSIQDEHTFPADVNALSAVLGFFEKRLEALGCPIKTQTAVSLAIEEVFVNVAHYAYGDDKGTATVGFGFDPESHSATFRIRDSGTPFDPLKRKDPDITLSAEERDIGGLGIFITKKTMDSLHYRYQNGENILTMRKIIEL